MNRPSLVLRSARSEDLSAVAAIEAACFNSDPWSRQSFEALLGKRGVSFIVADGAEPGAGVVGYAILLCAADEAELLNLAVAHDSRRRGVGAALLGHILDLAVAEGVRTVYLEVRDSNAAARKLYSSHGFIEVGRRRRYYERPAEDALILQRSAP